GPRSVSAGDDDVFGTLHRDSAQCWRQRRPEHNGPAADPGIFRHSLFHPQLLVKGHYVTGVAGACTPIYFAAPAGFTPFTNFLQDPNDPPVPWSVGSIMNCTQRRN